MPDDDAISNQTRLSQQNISDSTYQNTRKYYSDVQICGNSSMVKPLHHNRNAKKHVKSSGYRKSDSDLIHDTEIREVLYWGSVHSVKQFSDQTSSLQLFEDSERTRHLVQCINYNKVSTLFLPLFKDLKHSLLFHFGSLLNYHRLLSDLSLDCFVGMVPSLRSETGILFCSSFLAIIEFLEIRGNVYYNVAFDEDKSVLQRIGWSDASLLVSAPPSQQPSIYFIDIATASDFSVVESVLEKNWGLWQLERLVIVLHFDLDRAGAPPIPPPNLFEKSCWNVDSFPLFSKILNWTVVYPFIGEVGQSIGNHPAELFLGSCCLLRFYAAVLHQLDSSFWIR